MTKSAAHLIITVGLVLVLAATSWAQVESKAELFGGYSLLHSEPRFQKDLTGHGWDAAAAVNVTHFLDIVGDISRHNFSEDNNAITDIHASTFSYLFGPRIGWNTSSRWTPFGQALFGGRRTASNLGVNEAFPETTNQFAFALGGGLSVRLTRLLGLRIAQAEYMGTTSESDATEGFRFSAGMVWRF